MNCPKCGTQNPDDAQVCTSCSSPLIQPPAPVETVKVKTSIVSITALIFAIMTIFLLPIAIVWRGMLSAGIWLIAAILAIVLGIIGLIEIGLSAGKVAGKAFAAIAVVIPVVFYFLMYLSWLFFGPRMVAYRMVCGSNLAGLGRGMLIYANDYDNNYPRAGGPNTIWQPKINDWQAKDRRTAFFLKPDGTGGSATISSSLYLLVRYTEVPPKYFICRRGEYSNGIKPKEFNPAKYGVRDKEPEELWDFGPEPVKHCSYSYHMCYGPFPLNTTTSEPGQAVAADRNPWLDPHTDTTGFKWDDQTKTGGRENIKGYRKGNSGLHKREGQNVLFMDNHVYFEKASFCGVDQDNIYTYWNGSDIQQGAPPTLTSQPADKLDSLLVNEQPKKEQK